MSKIICLDLELNQRNDNPKIIQLGYIIADVRNSRVFIERSLIINPNEPLEERIITLTGITEERIKKEGMSLLDAYLIMCEDIKKINCTRTPVQWGLGDAEALRLELGLEQINFIFRRRIFDVKALYQIYKLFRNEGVAAGLEDAMKSLDLPTNFRYHDALEDAKATFKVFVELGKKLTLSDKIKDII